MNRYVKNAGLLALIGLVVLILIGYVSVRNTANQMETLIIQDVEACRTTENQAMKKVLDLVDVTENGHQYVTRVFSALSGNGQLTPEAQEFKDQYTSAVSGQSTTQQLLGFLVSAGVVSKTDILALDLQIANAVESGRNAVRDCGLVLTRDKNIYKTHIGMDASGRLTSFPNGTFASIAGLPNSIPVDAQMRPTKDIDGDYRITVLDFSPPVTPEILQKYNTGEDSPDGWVN